MNRNAKAICQTCPFYRPFDDEERAKERRPAGTGQCRAEPPRVAVSPHGEVGTELVAVKASLRRVTAQRDMAREALRERQFPVTE